jgi:predicted nucleic acid-binding protein
MTACLDANIVIYLVEQNPLWEPKASARIAALRAAGNEIAVCDAARLECLIGPYQTGNAADIASYAAFFAGPSVRMLPATVAVWERAARIRADHNFSALDALHLAAAAEHGCTRFLSNDSQLKRFPDVVVEILS